MVGRVKQLETSYCHEFPQKCSWSITPCRILRMQIITSRCFNSTQLIQQKRFQMDGWRLRLVSLILLVLGLCPWYSCCGCWCCWIMELLLLVLVLLLLLALVLALALLLAVVILPSLPSLALLLRRDERKRPPRSEAWDIRQFWSEFKMRFPLERPAVRRRNSSVLCKADRIAWSKTFKIGTWNKKIN